MKHEQRKKMFLIFHGRFPSEKAAAIFAAKDAEAFAEEGIEVVLIAPRRITRSAEDAFDYYKIRRNFRIAYLPVVDLMFLPFAPTFFFWVSFISFSLSSFFYLLFRAVRHDIVYSNEPLPLFLASFAFPLTFYEMQDFPESKIKLFGLMLRRIAFISVSNRWKKEEMEKVFSVASRKMLYEPNAVDFSEFDIAMEKEEARRKLSLPLDKKIIVYTGHLYGWKGVDTLALAARELPDEYRVFFVGGTPEDQARFRTAHGDCRNVAIVGLKPHSEIPLWQKAADLLVLPNTAKERISRYYTSPMKLFEYMASKRPIIASRIPALAGLVDERSVVFFEPDDPNKLAEAIKNTCANAELAESISSRAYELAKEFTWEKRAQRILRFMGVLPERR